MSKKESGIPDLKNEVRALQTQYNEITELRDLGRKVIQLKDELIWKKVEEIENQLNPINEMLTKITDSLPTIVERIAKEQVKCPLP